MIEPIEPINPDNFKPLDTDIVVEAVKKNNMPQSKAPETDLSEDEVSDSSETSKESENEIDNDLIGQK